MPFERLKRYEVHYRILSDMTRCVEAYNEVEAYDEVENSLFARTLTYDDFEILEVSLAEVIENDA